MRPSGDFCILIGLIGILGCILAVRCNQVRETDATILVLGKASLGLGMIFLFLGVVGAMASGLPREKDVGGGTLDQAVLAENWTAVADLCTTDANTPLAVHLRALRGHACLALNRNDESLVHFLTLKHDSDRRDWKAWAFLFAQDHPRSAVALYLKGDACARLGEWEQAVAAYSQALSHAKTPLTQAMILDARGVAHAELDHIEEARDDLELAIEKAPDFIDARCSLGTVLLLKEAATGAALQFEMAVQLSRERRASAAPALAWNGLACAQFGLRDWTGAGNSLVTATERLPLPLFVANLRALTVADENSKIAGPSDSPLFRPSDFLDWEALRTASRNSDEPIHLFAGGALPESLTAEVLNTMNRALDKIEFCERVAGRKELEDAPRELTALMQITQIGRSGAEGSLSQQQRDDVRELNRLLLEHFYPNWIARHDQRDPGMQLTITGKLVSSRDYKASLPTETLLSGYQKMEMFKTGANILGTLPFCGGLAGAWRDHLNTSMGTTITELNRRGLDFNPAGVVADLRGAALDRGDWPLRSGFGLAQIDLFTGSVDVDAQ